MKKLVPDVICESVFAIDLDKLKKKRILGLLVDIDNTLVPWGKPEIEEAFVAWVKRVKEEGFKICLVSNAKKERAQKIATSLGIPAVGLALKPLGRSFRRGMSLLNLAPDEVAVVGDQLFTDVLGGNRLGIHTILINPISKNELDTTKWMRRLEHRILETMVKRGLISAQHAKIRQGRD
ncbi:MAG: YqeG family HAD IIIA-type phosphatase [Firmicutes bacterium]|nr:YqeG family HAD IIIA-type phosphatase [Bacillota bacterium]